MPASASDAGVGAGMARAAAAGAAMNVYINLQDMAEDDDAGDLLRRADVALAATCEVADELEAEVWSVLGRDAGRVKTS
jgi:formiminotetrahydrofolate cyclodeaminase